MVGTGAVRRTAISLRCESLVEQERREIHPFDPIGYPAGIIEVNRPDTFSMRLPFLEPDLVGKTGKTSSK
jgi:hypothetical protein